MIINLQKSLEQRARREVRRVGLVARKSRWHLGSPENQGEFMLVDPASGIPEIGYQYDMSATEVIDYCRNL